MTKAILKILDEVNITFEGLSAACRRDLVASVEFFVPGAKFLPSVRLGRWNGKTSFCTMGGDSYINLLDNLLPVITKHGYELEIEDLRVSHPDFNFEPITTDSYSHVLWPEGHPIAGQPIVIKDHQVDVINCYLRNLSGINIAPTGSGKCLGKETKLDIFINNLAFSQFVLDRMTFTQDNRINIEIGQLANLIEEYKDVKLQNNQEVFIDDLELQINTPGGLTTIHYIIEKKSLGMMRVTLANGYIFRCAEQHVLLCDKKNIYAGDLVVGNKLAHKDGIVEVSIVEYIGKDDCLDINVDRPNLYYDSNGLIHHNTLITAILSHKVEAYGRSIVIVPTKDLVTQTEEDYVNMGLDVGVYFGDRKEYNKKHTICTWQSLDRLIKNSKDDDNKLEVDINTFFEDVICIMVDECHKSKAAALRSILAGPGANVPIRWGLTGTMPEEELDRIGVISCIGPLVGKINTKELQDAGLLAKLDIDVWQLKDLGAAAFTNYHAELKWLTTNKKRLEFLATSVIEMAETGSTLILVDRVETGEILQALIPDSVFVSGKMKSADRKSEYKEVQDIDGKIIIATFGVASTGVNIVRIYNLVLFEAGKSFVKVIQSIGRGIRVAPDKSHVKVYDICSNTKYSKQHLTKRKAFYKEAEYPFKILKVDY